MLSLNYIFLKKKELNEKIIEYENAEVSFQNDNIEEEELKYEIESKLKKRWTEVKKILSLKKSSF